MEAVFTCTICGEASSDICVACTKDTCTNHLCERCKRCSDCCVCEVRLISHHEHNGSVLQYQDSDADADAGNSFPVKAAPFEPDEA